MFSQHATAVDLCLFDRDGHYEWARLPLPACTDQVWHGYLAQGLAGQVYGFRVYGPYAPQAGHRFNPAKLLLDPYAREIVGTFAWRAEHFSASPGAASGSARDATDNGPWALKARVCADSFDWADDRPPRHALADSVIYEAHVRGLSMRHPGVPPELRGTYAGLACPAVVEHLQYLGVTALCLLPVQMAIDEQRLAAAGLANYWGYNTLAYFVPNPRYAASTQASAQRDEFRTMVRDLHAAGIEVILDVVYNHTAESDEDGPTLSFRGLDNAAWYRHLPDCPGRYDNVTGCGNSLDLRHPRVLQFVMDSLRYWVQEMHVDGFRFDLAVTLGRENHGFDSGAGFFDALRQDPVLAPVRLIAEPWDIGPGGYQSGAFPVGWSEWNGRFRDGVRAFWLRHGATRGELARRLCASSELFSHGGRPPQASINFLTAHDGFTLEDLVSYAAKHNLANGEDNRDGHDDNLSWNCGVEGPSDDPLVSALRSRLKRALLATLMLAQGVPQLLGGDELGRTQSGNNNAYCQDTPINWFEWSAPDTALCAFVANLTRIRRDWPQLRSTRWLDGRPGADGRSDVVWAGADGLPLAPAEWDDPLGRSLQCQLAGPAGRDLLLLFEGDDAERSFVLPPGRWLPLLDSSLDTSLHGGDPGHYRVHGPAVVVLARGGEL